MRQARRHGFKLGDGDGRAAGGGDGQRGILDGERRQSRRGGQQVRPGIGDGNDQPGLRRNNRDRADHTGRRHVGRVIGNRQRLAGADGEVRLREQALRGRRVDRLAGAGDGVGAHPRLLLAGRQREQVGERVRDRQGLARRDGHRGVGLQGQQGGDADRRAGGDLPGRMAQAGRHTGGEHVRHGVGDHDRRGQGDAGGVGWVNQVGNRVLRRKLEAGGAERAAERGKQVCLGGGHRTRDAQFELGDAGYQ